MRAHRWRGRTGRARLAEEERGERGRSVVPSSALVGGDKRRSARQSHRGALTLYTSNPHVLSILRVLHPLQNTNAFRPSETRAAPHPLRAIDLIVHGERATKRVNFPPLSRQRPSLSASLAQEGASERASEPSGVAARSPSQAMAAVARATGGGGTTTKLLRFRTPAADLGPFEFDERQTVLDVKQRLFESWPAGALSRCGAFVERFFERRKRRES